MDYFLPSFVQKRLLRYALSRLQLVDTEAIDLDSLGIQWGHRSTFELRDLGLKLEKLTAILQLPPTCKLLKARASLVRVTIPADIYSSSIIIEVDGINVHIQLLNDNELARDHLSSERDSRTAEESSTQPAIPTTNDLAQSFIESEPREERAEIEAAISSQSHTLQRSNSSSSDEDEVGLGNEAVSLPSFISGFLQGIVDRLRFRIQNINVSIDMELPQDAPVKRFPPNKLDPLTVSLVVGELSVGSVTHSEAQNTTPATAGRKITLDSIKIFLISDRVVFANYARFGVAPPSPSVTTSQPAHHEQEPVFSPSQSTSLSNSFSQETTHSMALDQSQVFDGISASTPTGRQSLENSTPSMDGRFSDAESETGYTFQRGSHHFEDSYYEGLDEQISDNPGYLDEVFHSQMADDDVDSMELSAILHRDTGTPRPSYPQIDSSQVLETWHDFEDAQSRVPSHHDLEETHFYEPLGDSTGSQLLSETTPSVAPEPQQNFYGTHSPEASSLPQEEDIESRSSHSSPRIESVPAELSESRLFSHEEASSMYMSAFSGTSHNVEPSMPGAWGSQSIEMPPGRKQNVADSIVYDSVAEEPSTPKIGAQSTKSVDDEQPTNTQSQSHAGLDQTLDSSSERHSEGPEAARRVLEINSVTVWIPQPCNNENPHDAGPETIKKQSLHDRRPENSSIDLTSSIRRSSIASSIVSDVNEHPGHRGADTYESLSFVDSTQVISVDFGEVIVRFDISSGWLLVKTGQKIGHAIGAWDADTNRQSADNDKSSDHSNHLKLSLDSCSVQFLDTLDEGSGFQGSRFHGRGSQSSSTHFGHVQEVILQAQIRSLKSEYLAIGDNVKLQVEVKKFILGSPTEPLISFNEDLQMRNSVKDVRTSDPRDLSINFVKNSASTKLNIATLPLHINFNIQKLEEIFGWLGGLSTLMELGSSIASVSTVRGGKSDIPKNTVKGVRFEGVPPALKSRSEPKPSVSLKVNARLAGVIIDLIGETCAVQLTTTALKAVSRYEGVGIQIDKATIAGPQSRNDAGRSATLDLENIRIEYLYSPKEVDLDRLLSLLTPSKDKYEEDDDIMLDTLFRQRRQGGVLRVAIAAVKLSIPDIEGLKPLLELPNELARLSGVTKYLPEDDRPGVMTLLLIHDFDSKTHVNKQIGDLRLSTQDFELAHISIPSLIAAQVKTISLMRNDNESLVGTAADIDGQSTSTSLLPILMLRYIADEIDPTIKIKLHTLRVEYTLPSIIALLGLEPDTTVDELAIKMASSVADLTDLAVSQTLSPSSGEYSSSDITSKPFRLSVSMRDCVVGLNPRDIPAKGLFVLTFAKFECLHQDKRPFDAKFEIKKATVMIIDDTTLIGNGSNARVKASMDSHDDQVKELASMGFVTVSFISSALLSVVVARPPNPTAEKSIDVELRDDLLILETCADSTQTMISLINGLAPPALPNKTLKYRTEVMPLQDMLSSFTGDAFTTDEVTDAEDVSFNDAHYNFEDTLDDEADYVSEFNPEEYLSQEKPSSSLTDPMADMSRSRHFMDSFHSQYNISSSVTDLEIQEDHFAKKSNVGGTAHRWNTSQNTYGLSSEVKLQGSPLRVRVRDVHFIWNLFDGYDWQRTRDTISKAVKDVEVKAAERRARGSSRLASEEDDEESVIGDFLFNSIYIGIPANKDPRELSRAINQDIDDMASETGSYITSTTVTGYSSRQNRPASTRGKKLRLSRSKHHKMTFELKGISADFVVFPPNSGETESTIDVRVNDLDIFDHIPTSTWKKFATYMNDAGERESGTSMVHLEIINVKPIAELAASEIVLKATVLPLRLHVDQDALDFLSRFFEFKDESVPAPSSPGDAPFLQRVEVNSIRVKLDFKPKRVDYAGLRSGRTTEFMNFFILDEADMVMRHVIIYGVSGFARLGQTLNDIWMPDIKRNQLPGVLAGLAPIRSLVNVGSGMKDLVVIPMREYKKDGRIVRSIQKGAFSFAKTTTNELIKLGAKLAIGTQTVLQSAEDFLSAPGVNTSNMEGDGDTTDEDEKKQISHYADQPVGVVQGLRGAFRSLERDLLVARDAIVAVPGEVMESSSAAGAAKVVLRHAPTVILRPAIGATRAVGQTLLGAGNSLNPANRRRIEDKYKRH